MKHFLLFGMALVMGVAGMAQVVPPVNWTFSAKRINAQTYEVHMTATMINGWHVYTQRPGAGPLPTSFKFTRNPLVVPMGTVKEVGRLRKVVDKSYHSEVSYYEGSVDFVQTVAVKGKAKVGGTIEFMAANANQTLPPKDIQFSVQVGQ